MVLPLLLALLCLTSLPVPAQEVVTYGLAENYAGRIDTLRMSVWLPATDDLDRPLVVWIHGGAFMAGNFRDLDSACARYARRGYVAVTVQYRLGFYSPFPVDPPFAYDRAEIVRACWRGVQDVRAALRYLRDRSVRYGIDTTCTVLAGESAGAIIALQTTIADVADSVPNEVREIGDVVRGFDRFERPDLGPLDPDTARPLPPITSLVNYYGAIMHPYMLNVRTFPAIVSYHQRDDRVVGCGIAKGLWGMPLDVGANYPVLWGSCAIEQLLSGGEHDPSKRSTMIQDGLMHELHDPKLIDSLTAAFLDRHGCDRPTSIERIQLTDREPQSLDNEEWTVVDLLGRTLGHGLGSLEDGVRWASDRSVGVVFVATSTRRTIVWR